MALIRRLAQEEAAKHEVPPAPAEIIAQPALQIEPAESEAPLESNVNKDVCETGESESVEEVQASSAESVSHEIASPKADRDVYRSSLDYLNTLRSLAPVFRAVTIYPGYDAAPEQVAAAVRLLSQVSVDLAAYIVEQDRLELDKAWAKKSLHSFSADLVSSHWISTVIGLGGAAPGSSVNSSVEYFIPSIQAALDLAIPLGETIDPDIPLQGRAQVALLSAIAPLAMEVEKYTTILNAHVPDLNISAEKLVSELGQMLMDLAMPHYAKFISEIQDATAEDRSQVLQALVEHASKIMLSSWELCRGEMLGAIKEASASVEGVREYLAQEQFVQGFPVGAMRKHAEDSLRRLTGTVMYAMAALRQKNGGQ